MHILTIDHDWIWFSSSKNVRFKLKISKKIINHSQSKCAKIVTDREVVARENKTYYFSRQYNYLGLITWKNNFLRNRKNTIRSNLTWPQMTLMTCNYQKWPKMTQKRQWPWFFLDMSFNDLDQKLSSTFMLKPWIHLTWRWPLMTIGLCDTRDTLIPPRNLINTTLIHFKHTVTGCCTDICTVVLIGVQRDSKQKKYGVSTFGVVIDN